ncbi:peptide chain release factor 1 [Entomortierella parvispora]|uniref:Peptide chain release factor 1 n=1 Tax=Entomortierella parvispora TaxID=205924 RepID=A0A9P3LS00_9FUNG|nr:peptide chain release factor 1 [Entomortierella parvispora]
MPLQSSITSASQAARSSSAFLAQHGWLSYSLADPADSSSTASSSSSQRRQSFSTSARLLSSSTDPVVFHTPMLNKMRPKLESMKELHDKVLLEINGQSTEGEDLSPSKFAEKTKQLHDLSLITDRFSEVEQQIRDLMSLRQMLEDPTTKGDPDLLEMTEEEIKETTERILEMEKDLLLAMLPTDTTDEANAILEIRAGTGGDEAGLFAADVLRMYERFAEKQRWKWDIISKTYDGLGSIKDATIAITGHNVFGQLKFESGVHRVQRVPATETQGRIHTSTVTVAIMPQPTEVQVQIHDSDVRVDVFRASGSGGQKVNTTDSAIRLTHLATGIVVAIQDERSNQKNRAKAFTILRAKLFEREREKLASERKNLRRQQVGSGSRSEKIRTYNFPQNRVTDHRINKTLHELESVLEGDALPEFIQALRVEEQTDLLMAMNEEES